jgi:hypothetical protein
VMHNQQSCATEPAGESLIQENLGAQPIPLDAT